MSELSAAEQKIVDYLAEAHTNERRLEAALAEHAKIAEPAKFRRQVQKHEKETRGHAQAIERRIKQLGASPDGGLSARAPEAVQAAQSVARKAVSLAQEGLDTVRGTSDQERAVKTARAEYAEEAGEIALYSALQALAEAIGDRDTSKLARTIRRDEERMAQFLADLIPELVRASVQEEIAPPRPQARSSSRPSRARATKTTSTTGSTSAKRSRSGSTKSTGSTRSSGSTKSKATGGASTSRRRTKS